MTMTDGSLDDRALGKAITRLADASVDEALVFAGEALPTVTGVRIGITGPPGAGKSTLIGRLTPYRLGTGRRVAVVAVDPTSPLSRGALLGDRVRMQRIGPEGLFIRSLASRTASDGLADNLPGILALIERCGYDDIIVETVGVGQVEYAVEILVDTMVLVLNPETGDHIQIMKAGALEIADILVVNKAESPAAARLTGQLAEVVAASHVDAGAWKPRIVETAIDDEQGVERLHRAIDEHTTWRSTHCDEAEVRRRRARYHLSCLVRRRAMEVLRRIPPQQLDGSLLDVYRAILAAMR
jgi:LAO/AO transport system kinase